MRFEVVPTKIGYALVDSEVEEHTKSRQFSSYGYTWAIGRSTDYEQLQSIARQLNELEEKDPNGPFLALYASVV